MTPDEQLHEEIRALVASKFWRMVRVYLLNRRAQLFNADPPTTRALWAHHGALHEVNRLLYAPEQALLEMAKTHMEGEPLPEELQPFWLPKTSEEDHG